MATTSLHEAIRVLYERSLLLQKSGEKAEGISSIRTKASEVLALCDREMSLKPSTAPVIHNTSTGTAPSNLRSKNSHKNTREDGLMPVTRVNSRSRLMAGRRADFMVCGVDSGAGGLRLQACVPEAQDQPSTVSSMSMSLMPMKGATMPPRP